MRIVVTHKIFLMDYQINTLKHLGDCVFYTTYPNSSEDWLNRCSNANVICTDKKYINNNNLKKLKNVFIVIPYRSNIEVNKGMLMANNITIKSFSRKYTESVSEWIIGMIYYYYRELHNLIRITDKKQTVVLKLRKSLAGKTITILGNGNIGMKVSKICAAMDMNIIIYKRGDNLISKVRNADIVVNCLRKNKSTIKLININNINFFKKGCFFISVTPPEIYDYDSVIYALNEGIFSAMAEDASSKNVGNIKDKNYQKLLKHPKILVTPHIAWMTDYEAEETYDLMIDEIKLYKQSLLSDKK